jgi:LysR family carnitine catabolism transcriptional activator
MNADIRHIRAFVAVARLGSFTRAAAALHVSQPALTVQIRQLEAALTVRLFDRNNRRVAITRAGRGFVAPFERVLMDLDAIADQARDLSSHRRGFVAVAALPSIAAGLLPRAIGLIARSHEGLVVRVRDVVAGRVLELVKSGDVDFGIGSVIRPDPDVALEPLLWDRLWAIARRDHPIGRRRSITLRELSAQPLVLTGPDSSLRQILERAFDQHRLPAHIAQEATYMTTAIGMVKAGLGVAVLPGSALELATDLGIRSVAIQRPVLHREIVILRRVDRSLSAAAQKLADTLRTLRP